MTKTPPPQRARPVRAGARRRKNAPRPGDEGAPGYYTGDHKPSVAEPGPDSTHRGRHTR